MKQPVKIISDGTSFGTKVLVKGVPLENVKKLVITADCDFPTVDAVIYLTKVPLEYSGDTTIKNIRDVL